MRSRNSKNIKSRMLTIHFFTKLYHVSSGTIGCWVYDRPSITARFMESKSKIKNPFIFTSLCSLNKNLQHLSVTGWVTICTKGVTFDDSFGFPELRYLKLEDNSLYLDGFKYCCANSPKLEEINVDCYFGSKKDYECFAKSIGKGSSTKPVLLRP